MNSTCINQFSAGLKVEGFYLIKSVECKTSSNNKKYFDFTLCDKTGDINAKLWEYKEEDEQSYKENLIIKVRGSVNEWMGSLQLKIDKIRLASEEDGINIKDLVPAAPYDAKYMYDEILKYLDRIQNEDIKNIVNIVLNDGGENLLTYPAAKRNHHSIRSGLLYHTLTMLRAGEKLCEIYTFLNTDLLFGGVILHDMAKLYEMEAGELGIVSDYTVEGQLLGHITQGVKLIENAAERVGAGNEVTMLLQHMVLSHHYEPEYGSPVKPMFPEAEVLHYLDIIDARMFDMRKAITETEKGNFSERIWSLENRKVYRSHIHEYPEE